jgi:hypothetical protein
MSTPFVRSTGSGFQFHTLGPDARSARIGFFASRLANEEASYSQLLAYAALSAHMDNVAHGTLVVPPPGGIHVPTMTNLIERGQLRVSDEDVELEQMDSKACHRNAVTIVKQRGVSEGLVLGHGYALSDGLWREHSWVHELGSNRMIETTAPWVAYFGYTLTDIEFAVFASCNS